MKIGIYARSLNSEGHQHFARELFSLLNQRGIAIYVHENLSEFASGVHIDGVFGHHDLMPDSIDFLLSLGGDGTVLDTLMIVRDTGIPVLGVNMGRFGFLASSQQEDIRSTIDELEKNSYSIQERAVLKLESDQPLFGDFPYALNDFVIHKKDTSSMITVRAYLNGVFLNAYWADGLICSTPTGSSGYSLSCGGPLLFPGSRSFVITPIAPHNLNVRPAVISEESVVSFETEGRTDSYLVTLDSRSETVTKGTKLAIQKANFSFRTVRLQEESYMNTIRKKLMWGLDNRN